MTLQVFLGNSSSAASLPNRQDEVTSKLIHLAAVNVHESKDSFHRLWTATSERSHHSNDVKFLQSWCKCSLLPLAISSALNFERPCYLRGGICLKTGTPNCEPFRGPCRAFTVCCKIRSWHARGSRNLAGEGSECGSCGLSESNMFKSEPYISLPSPLLAIVAREEVGRVRKTMGRIHVYYNIYKDFYLKTFCFIKHIL